MKFVVVVELTTVAAAQLYRYRRVSGPRERQQTKWVVFGLAVPITVYMLLTVLGLFFPLLAQRSPLLLLASNEAGFTLPLFLPLSFGFAMLRSRLWDIDVLINRALVYGALTASLALIYVFQPLRRRIQRLIDRRFYRSKYDAAKTVAAFSATLRQEVDLEQLREHLLAVVQETMQPSQVSLWLRPPAHDGTQRAPWRATPPAP
jgi:Zn-dependent protease with chaperone function